MLLSNKSLSEPTDSNFRESLRELDVKKPGFLEDSSVI